MRDPDNAFSIDASVPDMLRISGALLFSNARQALAGLTDALPRGREVRLDMSGVRAADSAGLACVLALMAAAHRDGGRVRVQAVPSGLQALAKVCQVDDLLADQRTD